MGTISGKILSSLLSASIVTTAVGYTGGQYINTIQSNIDTVTLKAILLNDEAATKIELANEMLQQKNKDITLLKEELDSLTEQLDEANAKVSRLEQQKTVYTIIEETSNEEIDSSIKNETQEITETKEDNESIDLTDTPEEPVDAESKDEQQEITEQSRAANATDDSSN